MPTARCKNALLQSIEGEFSVEDKLPIEGKLRVFEFSYEAASHLRNEPSFH